MYRKSVSVAMAVYNGQRYLKEQIDSILPQLRSKDELVISLDPSEDDSFLLLESYKDSRIKLYIGPGQGLLANFENAIKHTKNEIIFLSDQDDIWHPNKIENVAAVFDFQDVNVVCHDAKIVDNKLNILQASFFKSRNSGTGILKNIIQNTYVGCCMAFKREMKQYILPFPKYIPMHDQFIGLLGEKHGNNKFLHQNLTLYRRHENNASNLEHATISQMILWRLQIIWAILKR